jgi:methionyl-tRNA formyltransferase
MRIAFFGTASFAVPTLERLADSISLVVSQPDRATGRGMKLHSSPVKQAAISLGLPVETPEKCRASEFIERIREEKFDALLVAAYGQILPESLLEAARCGAINLHGSILPKYRGAAPIQRSILNGDTETGVTLMQMDKGMDTGDIIAFAKCPIEPQETYGDIETKLGFLAAITAAEWLPRVVSGDYSRTAQNSEDATHAPKVDRSEGELSFLRNVDSEYNRFRAFTPSPGAFLMTRFGRLKLIETRKSELCGMAGTILKRSPEPIIAFEGGSLCLISVSPDGKPRMRGSDWLNGVRLKEGDPLLPSG